MSVYCIRVEGSDPEISGTQTYRACIFETCSVEAGKLCDAFQVAQYGQDSLEVVQCMKVQLK